MVEQTPKKRGRPPKEAHGPMSGRTRTALNRRKVMLENSDLAFSWLRCIYTIAKQDPVLARKVLQDAGPAAAALRILGENLFSSRTKIIAARSDPGDVLAWFWPQADMLDDYLGNLSRDKKPTRKRGPGTASPSES